MRTIKFRGKYSHNGEWVFGSLLKINGNYHIVSETDMDEDGHHIRQDSDKPTWVNPETFGQFTGIVDKNGKEIYEGDIVEFYCLNTYCINPDCEAHLLGYSNYIRKETAEVEFFDSSFGIEDSYSGNFTPLAWCGLHEDLDDLKEMQKNDAYFDTMGYGIDDSIIGIKVIGNIHDNKEVEK